MQKQIASPQAIVFKSVDWQVAQNAEIDPDDSELVISVANRKVNAYNLLTVQNFDATCNIEVRLGSLNSPFRRFTGSKNGGFINLGPDIPIWFTDVFIVNLNSTTAVTEETITINAAKVVPTAITAINTQGDAIQANTSNQFGLSFS